MIGELLGVGYFPSELPPSFTTDNFATTMARAAHANQVPGSFRTARSAKLCPFSLARGGNFRFRRRLSIVNPIHYFNLSSSIAANWAALVAEINRSTLSHSKPIVDLSLQRAVRAVKTRRELLPIRARNRSGSIAIVLADISEFYHSIYTHSIPWALHTKPTAKANMRARGAALLGDEIDKLVRKAQDDQTMGVPIGPDTSFIISEVVLAAADRELLDRAPRAKGVRYFDDYELPCSQLAEAEAMLADLQEVLLGYELRLNPRKTSVQLPPIEFESEWVREIRAFDFRTTASGEAIDLIGYFDLVTKHRMARPDEHIAKYAITRLVDKKFVPHDHNLLLFQSLLCQIATAEPGSIREVMVSLIHVSTQGKALDRDLISETLGSVVVRHAQLGHHYEVAWCLWAAIALGLILEAECVAAISKVDNSVVAILALDAQQQGLTPGLDTTLWEAHMGEQDLYDEQWLLSYEANMHGWLPSLGAGDHVSADANFAFLKAEGVHFYVSSVPIMIPPLIAGYGP
jgi:hypothetical protein